MTEKEKKAHSNTLLQLKACLQKNEAFPLLYNSL